MSIDVKKGNIISVGIVLTCNSNVLQSKTFSVFFSFLSRKDYVLRVVPNWQQERVRIRHARKIAKNVAILAT